MPHPVLLTGDKKIQQLLIFQKMFQLSNLMNSNINKALTTKKTVFVLLEQLKTTVIKFRILWKIIYPTNISHKNQRSTIPAASSGSDTTICAFNSCSL